MAKWTFDATESGYANMWRTCKVNPGIDMTTANRASSLIISYETRYKAVEAQSGVPWFWIGAIHYREASNSFKGAFCNGDAIIGTGKKTINVPRGRGPYDTWEQSALDEIKVRKLDTIAVWSAERMLYEAECYNGLGYISHRENSPYVWAGSNHEQTGLYTSDGNFNGSVSDTRAGVAALLLRMTEMRSDIAARIVQKWPIPPDVPKPLPKPIPPASGGFFVALAQILRFLFWR